MVVPSASLAKGRWLAAGETEGFRAAIAVLLQRSRTLSPPISSPLSPLLRIPQSACRLTAPFHKGAFGGRPLSLPCEREVARRRRDGGIPSCYRCPATAFTQRNVSPPISSPLSPLLQIPQSASLTASGPVVQSSQQALPCQLLVSLPDCGSLMPSALCPLGTRFPPSPFHKGTFGSRPFSLPCQREVAR